ncbi:MAG: (d)CMP kinase [Planctomycetaceae bacterium]|jgi:cytidylate kinase|nr:(d)CMP kinase [Planctomycetaceae bacterium]
MIITIDGPAGAGKSTVAKRLARFLSEQTGKSFEYLDTGSMYRAVALFGLRRQMDWQMPGKVTALAESAVIDVVNGRTLLNGEDVTEAVRQPEVTEKSRFAADNPSVRQMMVALQRKIADRILAGHQCLVTEGRDQGTAVFPHAACRIFLTATPEERAKRRLGELQQQGRTDEFQEILQQITDRDNRDAARTVGPLREPEGAFRLVSDGMTIDEVVAEIAAHCRSVSASLTATGLSER